MDERLARTAEAVRTVGADWAILTSPDAVCYASGHVVPIEAGPSPFAGGPTTCLVAASGICGVVAANVEAAAAAASWADAVELYEGFAFDHPVPITANFEAALRRLAARLGVGGRIASERGLDPSRLLADAGEPHRLDIAPALQRQRATKTAGERILLARAAEAASVGQRAFQATLRPGRTELELFAEVRCAIETFAGERVPITGDFVAGRERTAAFTGWPGNRRVEAGDPVMADLAPRVAGYWGDSCTTCVAGEPSAGFLCLFAAAEGALRLAVATMRPGLRIDALDAALRERVAAAGFAYPHHSGHSLGTAVHEWPRIVPYEPASLEAGMVLMVEPGAYHPDLGGVRTEWMIEVTPDGCRPLTLFDHVPAVPAGRAAAG